MSQKKKNKVDADGIDNSILDRSNRGKIAIVALIIILAAMVIASFLLGSGNPSLAKLIHNFSTLDQHSNAMTSDYAIFIDIRLPRIVGAILIGSALAVSGVLMQGLFRNPLADPGLMGVSSGAALGATFFIIFGHLLPAVIVSFLGTFTMFFGSFIGGLVVSFILYAVATKQGRTSIAVMLLAGIAIAAFTGAVVGLLVYIANDSQLRDITFWGLGSLVGINWSRVILTAPIILISLAICPVLSHSLNALSLGEAVASHLGFNVQRVKVSAIILVSLMCGAAVSLAGGIGFIGIIIPHLLRLSIGPDHRYLIPCSALLGASFLIFTDDLSRTLVAPSELPIGIFTAAVGAPFFLWILLSKRGILEL